jgi:hypothetical protein
MGMLDAPTPGGGVVWTEQALARRSLYRSKIIAAPQTA